MNPSDYVLGARYDYNASTNTWCAVIAKQVRDRPKDIEVISVGVEYSEELILIWIRETINLMRKEGRLDVSIPDAIEREANTKH